MANGYNQQEELNYDETFSQVAKMVCGRTVISLVASRNWPLAKMDVNNAFHEREVYKLGLYGSASRAP